MPMPEKKYLRVGEAAALAEVSVETLRRWADEGRVACLRTPTGQRRFRAEDIRNLITEVPIKASA